jgi:hypothetical protein
VYDWLLINPKRVGFSYVDKYCMWFIPDFMDVRTGGIGRD